MKIEDVKVGDRIYSIRNKSVPFDSYIDPKWSAKEGYVYRVYTIKNITKKNILLDNGEKLIIDNGNLREPYSSFDGYFRYELENDQLNKKYEDQLTADKLRSRISWLTIVRCDNLSDLEQINQILSKYE